MKAACKGRKRTRVYDKTLLYTCKYITEWSSTYQRTAVVQLSHVMLTDMQVGRCCRAISDCSSTDFLLYELIMTESVLWIFDFSVW